MIGVVLFQRNQLWPMLCENPLKGVVHELLKVCGKGDCKESRSSCLGEMHTKLGGGLYSDHLLL